MDHAATLRRAYDLINAGDIDGFGELIAEDVVVIPAVPLPPTDQPGTTIVAYKRSVKKTPVQPEEFEMYNVTADPMELANLYGVGAFASQQQALVQLLAQQRTQKRLRPASGNVPGEPA